MGSYTVVASYYNRCFYDICVLHGAEDPIGFVNGILQQVPASPAERLVWIEQQTKRLESSEPYLLKRGHEIMIKENNRLIPDGRWYTKTYVLDFDNQVFTVHGTVHFSLHHLPLETWEGYVTHSRSAPSYSVWSAMKPTAPLECIGAVSRWPIMLQDTHALDKRYKVLRPVETRASDWGVPSWDELSPSRTLSLKLVQAVLTDHADIFTNPDVADQRSAHNLCCWQVISAAAPSLLVCPPTGDLTNSFSVLMLPKIDNRDYDVAKSHSFKSNIRIYDRQYEPKFYDTKREEKQNNWDHIYWTLRGCLVTFCPQLDTTDSVKSEVVAMAAALKRSPSQKSVGIVYSGKHVVAVSIDAGIIRHTPALLVHDLKLNIQHGALLLVHLLGAQLGNKTFHSLSQRHYSVYHSSSGVFPDEILTEIVLFSDYQTYLRLFQVSHHIRSVCLSYPRVGESILMRAIDGGFIARDRTSGHQHAAHLQRVGWKVHSHLDSTFHIRQAGFARESDLTEDEFMIPTPNQDLYRRFTESRRRENMRGKVDMRMIVIWGKWVMKNGTTDNEGRAATPRCPAYWSFIFSDDDTDSDM